MPRALMAEWLTVNEADRDRAMTDWRRRRGRLRMLGCRYWVFENADERGRFLEFTEANDEQTLRAARAQADADASADILTEVELS